MLTKNKVCAPKLWITGTLMTMIGLAIQPALAAEDVVLRTISSRPDVVSGGDTLVMLIAPDNLKWTAQLNGSDVTRSFQRDENSGNSLALLTGLRIGKNLLTLRVNGQSRAKLELVNHPLIGPVFSGPHQQPFICQTEANGL